MFGLGKVTCFFCQKRVRQREVRKAQDARGACICSGCYARWDGSGRKCIACDTPVRGMQDLGFFADRPGLGHADCGGVRVLRA
jgi:hypothetical protein